MEFDYYYNYYYLSGSYNETLNKIKNYISIINKLKGLKKC